MIPDEIVKSSEFARLATRVLLGGKSKLVAGLFDCDQFVSLSRSLPRKLIKNLRI